MEFAPEERSSSHYNNPQLRNGGYNHATVAEKLQQKDEWRADR